MILNNHFRKVIWWPSFATYRVVVKQTDRRSRLGAMDMGEWVKMGFLLLLPHLRIHSHCINQLAFNSFAVLLRIAVPLSPNINSHPSRLSIRFVISSCFDTLASHFVSSRGNRNRDRVRDSSHQEAKQWSYSLANIKENVCLNDKLSRDKST